MYHFVEDTDRLRSIRNLCNEIIAEVEEEVREQGIGCQRFLIGSGARNMVTQNGRGKIDFDFNLNILSCDDWSDCCGLKETVRKQFNKVMRWHGYRDVSDSRSALTTRTLWLEGMEFSIDLAIVTRNNEGKWERLIHKKTGFVSDDEYYWNESPNSGNLKEKEMEIKEDGLWNQVRETYLAKKNMYLERQEEEFHPSFNCYIEAVNEVYNKYY